MRNSKREISGGCRRFYKLEEYEGYSGRRMAATPQNVIAAPFWVLKENTMKNCAKIFVSSHRLFLVCS